MRRFLAPAAAFAIALAACGPIALPAAASENVVRAPAAERTARESGRQRTAIFAGGCFWGVEAVFSHVPGVTSAVSGYHGGTRANADYSAVSAGRTNHVEAVRITYDPSVVRYDQLLRIFFSVIADPTLRDQQGPDRGPHYNAALIPLSAEQTEVARAYLAQMRGSGVWDRPILTGIATARTFYPAEAYHQDFAQRNPNHGYIRRWDLPKIRALQRLYPMHYRARFQTG